MLNQASALSLALIRIFDCPDRFDVWDMSFDVFQQVEIVSYAIAPVFER